MKTDEEIGRNVSEFINSYFPSVKGYFESLGAAARKAVGERPRMMIEGMDEMGILEEMKRLYPRARPGYITEALAEAANIAHRLANTPALDPVDKVEEEARRLYEIYRAAIFRKGELEPLPWSEASAYARKGWFEIARVVLERGSVG